MKFTTIELNEEHGIAILVMNRPDALNAINAIMLSELKNALEDIIKDEAMRVVVITGKGTAFSAGADLGYIKGLLGDPQSLLHFVWQLHEVLNTIEDCPKPVIAAVKGFALAGGLELVNVCDIVIASEDAKLGDAHANYGLVAGSGGTQRLPRLIGPRKAKELIFTGNWLSALEAERVGLVNKVVKPDQLLQSTMEIAVQIAEKSPLATAMAKHLVNRGLQTDLTTGLELELNTVQHLFTTEDTAEGLRAFEEKRKPIFRGR